MPDRLTELQRQRALAAEQLAWFDREIAKESGQAPAAPAPIATAPVATGAAQTAEEILAQYRKPVPSSDKEIKRGCYLYALFAFGLLVIFVVGAYYLFINIRS